MMNKKENNRGRHMEMGTKDVVDVINRNPFNKRIILLSIDGNKERSLIIDSEAIIHMKRRRVKKSLLAKDESSILTFISSSRDSRSDLYILVAYELFSIVGQNEDKVNVNAIMFETNKATGKLKETSFRQLDEKIMEKINEKIIEHNEQLGED